ncbi:MAG: hydroxyisourate hydrolase [Halieaceae bacterium]|jgi:5-hydroxyisourate hydrolase|nr:hydroxyisourate hydrolase [Halieaceae bacterium]
MKAPITTHILDLQTGQPAAGVVVRLSSTTAGLALAGVTDGDGRINAWGEDFSLQDGQYQLQFDTADWFAANGRECFFPEVNISFMVSAARPHYHVPLLLSPFGYSTYRGS